MYLSKITFVSFSKKLFKDISSVYRMHQFVMSAFPPNVPDRILFRMESDYILVQSSVKPDWDKAQAEHGYIQNAEVKAFEPNVKVGDVFYFKLVANPTTRHTGKRFGIYDEDKLIKWMVEKGKKCGFAIGRDVYVVREDRVTDHRKKCLVYHLVEFRGKLKVIDADAFICGIKNGIGTAKGFGFGMLSVARA